MKARSRHEEAEAAYRRALEIDSRYADAWYNLGLALDRQGKTEPAKPERDFGPPQPSAHE
ncbi:MAG: tetratricopeptide repeat protein [Planctomycetota bacterium]